MTADLVVAKVFRPVISTFFVSSHSKICLDIFAGATMPVSTAFNLIFE